VVGAEESEARQLAAAEEREQAKAAPEESECDPNYTGACLDPYASDYDCEGGSGNGPDYTGTVTVVGEDHYGLDADGDGTGCEAG
jgi:resuscitation-promoting factor RpfB